MRLKDRNEKKKMVEGKEEEKEKEREKRKRRNNGPSFKYLWGNSTRGLGRQTSQP